MAFHDIVRKKIEYDDDLVIVYDENNNAIYKGMEDYEPLNNEDWKWNKKLQAYELQMPDGNIYTKVCLSV